MNYDYDKYDYRADPGYPGLTWRYENSEGFGVPATLNKGEVSDGGAWHPAATTLLDWYTDDDGDGA